MKPYSQFEVCFKTNNSTFEGEGRKQEIARILREVAQEVEQGKTGGAIKDINGNTVGIWKDR